MTEDIATRMLALRPWDGLDLDAASGAVPTVMTATTSTRSRSLAPGQA
jgi:hypothetical protein